MVTIEYECETDFDLGLDCPALAKMVAEKVLDMEKCPWDAQVNLVLTDNEEIKRVNTEFRGIERATDVLSFPMLPFETPADYSVAEDDESCFDLDSGELLLGDIMISAERAAAQAEEYGHSVKREFCFLVAHSMLHLLGYDHMTPEEAADMEARQDDVHSAGSHLKAAAHRLAVHPIPTRYWHLDAAHHRSDRGRLAPFAALLSMLFSDIS